jgi:hypothetical protein
MTVLAPPNTASAVSKVRLAHLFFTAADFITSSTSDSSGVEYRILVEGKSGTIENNLISLGTAMILTIGSIPQKREESDFSVWLQQAQTYLQNLSEEELAMLKLSELSLRDAWGDEDAIWDEV